MRRRPLILLVVALAAFAATARAAAPVSPEAAAWIDRAVAELPAVRKEDESVKKPAKGLDYWTSEEYLDVMLFECRGTEADRARILEIARRYEKTPPESDALLDRFMPVNQAAFLYAWAGDKAAARRLLPAIEKFVAEVRPDPGVLSFDSIIFGGSLMTIHDQLGDLTDADLGRLGTWDLEMLMLSAADGDRQADVARYARFAAKEVLEATKTRPADRERSAVRLASRGQVDAAHELANTIPAASEKRATAFAGIAVELQRAGKMAGAARDLRLALDAALSAAGDDRRRALDAVLREACEVGGGAMIEAAADALDAELARADDPRFPTLTFSDHVDVARGYAAARLRPKFDRAVSQTDALVPRLSKEDASRGWVQVAQTYARADDKPGVDAALAKSRATGPLRDYDRWCLELIAAGYAEAGDFKNAVEFATASIPAGSGRVNTVASIAAKEARAGLYTEAEQALAGTNDAFEMIKVRRLIVVERVRTKRTAGLAEWIAARPTARERAVLYLAAAQQLLGRDGRGKSIVFRPRA